MTPHLAHKLPWDAMGKMYVHHKTQYQRRLRKGSTPLPHHKRQLTHIARVFSRTLREFQATDKTPLDDKELLDPRLWGEYDWSMDGGGGLIGIYDSLVWGYIELNLLLLDPDQYQPLMMPTHRSTMVMCFLLGASGTGHDEDIAANLKRAFEKDRGTMKPLTPKVLDVLQDHAKLLFKCMYLISGENDLLHDENMVSAFFRFFGWDPEE